MQAGVNKKAGGKIHAIIAAHTDPADNLGFAH